MLSMIRIKILSARIEWHWHHIMLCRKKQNSLLNKSATFKSASFLRANSRLDYHSVAVMKLTNKFKLILSKRTANLIKVRDKSICSSCREIIKQM